MYKQVCHCKCFFLKLFISYKSFLWQFWHAKLYFSIWNPSSQYNPLYPTYGRGKSSSQLPSYLKRGYVSFLGGINLWFCFLFFNRRISAMASEGICGSGWKNIKSLCCCSTEIFGKVASQPAQSSPGQKPTKTREKQRVEIADVADFGGGSSQHLDTWLITMVTVSFLRIGLWDPFHMAELHSL